MRGAVGRFWLLMLPQAARTRFRLGPRLLLLLLLLLVMVVMVPVHPERPPPRLWRFRGGGLGEGG